MLVIDRRVRLLTSVAAAVAMLGLGALSTPASAQSAAEAPPQATRFMIRAFQVKGNRLLSAQAVEDAVYPFMGPDKTPDDVEHARAALQGVFEKQGYATVSVAIPDQAVDSGIIRLDVEAQVIGKVTVTGGHRTSKSWVLARAPSLTPGAPPNFQAVQQNIVALNQSVDRRITPDVKPGVAPGTIDVNLKVEDTPPVHGSLEVNNDNSVGTTDLRVSGMLRYDDLWGRGDSLSVSAQTAPRRSKDATVFSGNYLARFGSLQVLGYYVHSDSDVAVVGGTTVVGKGDLAGVRVIIPISQSTGFYQSLTAGIDYKNFKEDVALGADRSDAPVEYFPATIGWRGDWNMGGNKANLTATATFGLRGLGDGQAKFDFKRFDATPDFFYLKLDGADTYDAPFGLQLYGHITGQWSGSPLISNEEFSVGGVDTVRGYFESELLGDYGAAVQTELRSPQLAGLTNFKPISELRLHLFWDGGFEGINSPLIGQDRTDYISSAGVGAQVKLVNHVNGAIDLGAPLIAGPNTRSGPIFGRFRIWGEF
jgi:hemolysin activation/secretion protein